MLNAADVVFLCDVDNTLLDNDRFNAELDARLERDFGAEQRARYRAIYAERRDALGYADYLGSLQVFREGLDADPDLLRIGGFILDFPFADLLYPQALAAAAHLGRFGRTAILSDGDIVLQPRKVARSGLAVAFHDNVLIYLHKQHMLPAVRERYPARHYVMVDDKPSLLAAMKAVMGADLTTVFVRQGHYAQEQMAGSDAPTCDVTVERIGDVLHLDLAALTVAADPPIDPSDRNST